MQSSGNFGESTEDVSVDIVGLCSAITLLE
jgi:hypothetical protein